MIDWKRVAKIEYGYGKRLYDEYHECQEELNRHAFPDGAKLQTPTRKDALRPAREWAAIVQNLERQLLRERERNLMLLAEQEGWRDEALMWRGLIAEVRDVADAPGEDIRATIDAVVERVRRTLG